MLKEQPKEACRWKYLHIFYVFWQTTIFALVTVGHEIRSKVGLSFLCARYPALLSVTLTHCQYRTQPRFQSFYPPWPSSVKLTHCWYRTPASLSVLVKLHWWPTSWIFQGKGTPWMKSPRREGAVDCIVRMDLKLKVKLHQVHGAPK